MTQIAITGAGGFIGSAVLEQALEQGFRIRAHLGPEGGMVNAPPAGTRSFRADIGDQAAIMSFLEETDVVVHLAGPASVRTSWSDPLGCVRAHVGGTANVLEACRAHGIGRLVYLSSAEVYAAGCSDPVDEDSPVEPRSPYGAAKLAAEHLIGVYGRGCGMAVRILRLFSVFGPRQREGVVEQICRQSLSGGPVELHAAGAVRDFCFVDDVAEAVLLAVRATEAGGVGTVNIGRGEGTTVGELAERAQAVLGLPSAVRHKPGGRRPGMDVRYLVADTCRAQRELGWSARTSLEDGLRRTFAALERGAVR